MIPSVTAIVPTLGDSSSLPAALRSLRQEGGNELEIVVVLQGSGAIDPETRQLIDRFITAPEPLGFAVANNLGLAETRSPWWLLLNDDAELHPGWLLACRSSLEGEPELAAVQGANFLPTTPAASPLLDGAGTGWSSRGWQAQQIGRGGPLARTDPYEVFGVSATACLLRRSAIEACVGDAHGPFDPRLETYYEDVDLAVRLRSVGWQAACVPQARATHRGGGTASALGRRRTTLLYGNRYLTVTRLLGSHFRGQRPSMILRDLRDIARRPRLLGGVLAGWRRASHLWDGFAHDRPPLVSRQELRRFGADG